MSGRRERLRLALRVAGAAAALGALALLAVLAGVAPLSAAGGHWPITEWLLRFGRDRTVAARALWIEAPPLDDAALVLRGAGHYDIGCRPCHGAPGEPPPVLLAEMLPTPPPLDERLLRWSPEELFWIVGNGFKMTGMPGWPSQQRDDEVWAMVAFLVALPELEPEEYRRLARNEEWRPPGSGDRPPAAGTAPRGERAPGVITGGEPTGDAAAPGGEAPAAEPPAEAPPPDAARPLEALSGDPPAAVVETCRRCHGEDGRGRGVGAYPRLAGQRREYLAAQLAAFAAGERHSGTMQPVAAALDRETIADLAAYYAARAPGPPPGVAPADVPSTAVSAELVDRPHEPPGAAAELLRADPAALARGRAIATRGIPARRVPACVECHGPTARPRNPHYPTLAGQYPEYLVLQLELLAAGRRGGSPYLRLMNPIAHRLEPAEMRDVAFWFATQPPGGGPPAAGRP
ncbi:MAG TPA: c-type cytochrome [Thermoanaerobaculia bacterium]